MSRRVTRTSKKPPLPIPFSPKMRRADISSWPNEVVLVEKALEPVLRGKEGEGNLYLGGIGLTQPDMLRLLNIGCVITVMHHDVEIPENIEHKYYPMLDSADAPIDEIFDESSAIIDRALNSGRNVLVHCYAGRSRSVTTIVAFLMQKRGIGLPEADKMISVVQPESSVNLGFCLVLEALHKRIFETPLPNLLDNCFSLEDLPDCA